MLLDWATELAALAQSGLVSPSTPYDEHRYTRIAALAAELAQAPPLSSPAPLLPPYGPPLLPPVTAIIAGEAAVFDPSGAILLIQRTDSGLWCLPGGAADVSDLPAAVAERETWEETGLRVRAELLIGVYTVPPHARRSVPLHVLTFLCHYLSGAPVVTHESLDVGYFPSTALPPLHGTQDRRVTHAFAARAAGPTWHAVFD